MSNHATIRFTAFRILSVDPHINDSRDEALVIEVQEPNKASLLRYFTEDDLIKELNKRHKDRNARTMFSSDKTPIFFEPPFPEVERKPIDFELVIGERDEDK